MDTIDNMPGKKGKKSAAKKKTGTATQSLNNKPTYDGEKEAPLAAQSHCEATCQTINEALGRDRDLEVGSEIEQMGDFF